MFRFLHRSQNNDFQNGPLMGALYTNWGHSSTLNLSTEGYSRGREEVLFKEFIPTPETACLRGTLQHTAVATAQYLYDVSIIRSRTMSIERILTHLNRYYTISMILGTVALAYSSVPLYKMVRLTLPGN